MQQSRIDFSFNENEERKIQKKGLELSRMQQFAQLIEELPTGNTLVFIHVKDPICSVMDIKQILDDRLVVMDRKVGQNLKITKDELNYIEVHLQKDCCMFSSKQYCDVLLLEVMIQK